MHSFSGASGKKTYIRSQNVGQIEEYCASKKLDFTAGVNQILADFFSHNFAKDSPDLASDIQRRQRKLELIKLMIQPSFLELLEVSGQLRSLVHDSQKSGRDGKKVRKVFEGLYTRILELN